MNKQRKTSNILNVFQYDESTGAVTLPSTLDLTAPGSSDDSTKAPTTAWVRALISSLGYVTLSTEQTITGLKTIVRSGDVLNFKIGADNLYALKIVYNQNELVGSGEATWSFENTFNNGIGTGITTTPISFFRGVLVTGQRLLSASVNANLLDYYGNNPSGRYPVYAYNTGVQQFASGVIVGDTAGVVNAATGAIADLPAGVVANFKGRVIGSNAVNNNEFVTLSQLTTSSGAYLPLSGGTLTGPLNGTSATFTVDGVATNSVLDILTLSHTTSSTAASGLGAGILFKSERPSGGINLSRAAIYGISGSNPDDDGDLTFYTRTDTSGAGFNEKMRITSDGNVGIGTDTPTAGKLVVNGNISISGNNYLDFNNGDARIVNTSGQLSFQTYTVGSFATRMIITGPGNVGIGASSLLERLSVSGNIHVEGTGNSIYFDTDGSGRSIQQYVTNLYQFHIVNARGNSARFMLGNGSITLGTSNTPQFTINTSTGASSFTSTVTSSGGFIGSLSGNASTASTPGALASRSGNFSSGTANSTENVDISSYYLPYFSPVYFYFNVSYNGNGAIQANWLGLADAHYFNNGTANIIWADDGATGGASMPSVSVSVQGSTYNTRYLRVTFTATGGYAPNNWNWNFGVWNAFP